MTSTTRQIIYGLAALIGIIVTWYFNLQIILYEGFTVSKFISDNYVNAASASVSNDLTVVVFVFLFWSFLEARKLKMRHWWLFPVLTFTVAIAFTYPLFLLMRERKLSVNHN